MKKICFVTTVHRTLKSFILKFAKYLHETGDYDISFICSYDKDFADLLPDYIHYYPVSMRRGVSLGGIAAMLKMRKIFKREKFDLVQYSTPNASFYASIAAKLAGIPVRLYCQWGMVYVSMHGIRRAIFKSLEKTICRLSTQIEPDSRGNLQFGHNNGLYPPEKGAVVWNGSTGGIDLEKFDISQKALWRAEIRGRHNIPQDAVVFGFVGRITGDKGINELFLAFREMLADYPQAWLMMVGNTEKERSLRQDLYAWAQQEPHVVFCGRTNEVAKYFAALDVHVLPSYREGFGSVIIEAEAMEVPVIVTDIPGPTEAMSHDLTGLSIPKQDPEALLAAMKTLYDSPELRSRYGKAGREYVAQRFEQSSFFAHTEKDRAALIEYTRRKKICFVTTVHGTLQAFVLALSKYLYESGKYDITFICNEDKGFAESLPCYIHFIPVPMERGISFGGVSAMLKMAKIFKREKFDLVQYSTPNASVYASIAAKIARIPARLYCQWGLAYVGFHGMKRRAFKRLEKMVCHLSTQVEPDSYGNLNFSHQEGLYPENKGAVIWNGSASGVNLDKFDISRKDEWRKAIRSKYSLPEDAFVFGFVGRITGDKGINELFTAAQTLLSENPKAYLMLVGRMEKAASVCESLYQWAQSEPRVLFCGPTTTVEQFLSAMDTYVLPSYREGFGMVVVEAEAMGVPVVVTNIPGPTDAMIENQTGLLVKKADVPSLVSAIRRLASDPQLRKELGQNGHVFAATGFEQTQLFKLILQDRRKLLESSEKSHG